MGETVKILSYFDGSDRSLKALAKAEGLLDLAQDELLLLMVIPKVKIEGMEGFDQEHKKKMKDILDRQAEILKGRAVHCRAFFEEGDIVDIIVNMADYYEVATVVLGYQTEEKMSPFTVGSISEEVSKRCHRPVLAIQ